MLNKNLIMVGLSLCLGCAAVEPGTDADSSSNPSNLKGAPLATTPRPLLIDGIKTDLNGVDSNNVYASSNYDMTAFTQIPTAINWQPRSTPETIFFNNQYFVFGGKALKNSYVPVRTLNDIYSSSDGVYYNYRGALPTPMASATACDGQPCYSDIRFTVLNNTLYLIDGGKAMPNQTTATKNRFFQSPSVYSSTDGINWTQKVTNAPFGYRYGMAVVTFKKKMYLIGGRSGIAPNYENLNDIWSSSDGVTWTKVNSNPGWQYSFYSKALVYKNQIFVIGGNVPVSYGIKPQQEVYSSSDGVNYTRIQNKGPVFEYMFSDGIVVKGKMWVAYPILWDRAPRQDFLYSSTDGITWNREPALAPWSPSYSGYRLVAKPDAECSDGNDNDGNGLIDYPNDPGCSSALDNDETTSSPLAR